MIKLEMDFTFNSLSTTVKIWHYKLKRFRKLTALFDTGANISVIDIRTFNEFGYNLNNARDAFVNTASHNDIAVKRTVIHDLMLDELEIGPFSADVIRLPMIHCQMILGLNVIREFKTILDFDNEIIEMIPKNNIEKISLEKFDCNNSRFGEGKLHNVIYPLNIFENK
jgi:hypothetical protein